MIKNAEEYWKKFFPNVNDPVFKIYIMTTFELAFESGLIAGIRKARKVIEKGMKETKKSIKE